MAREQYRTPDEDVATEFERVCRLFSLALGRPSDRLLFDSLMGEANEQGLDWVQGLEYVIETRRQVGARGTERRYLRRGVSGERKDMGDLRRAS